MSVRQTQERTDLEPDPQGELQRLTGLSRSRTLLLPGGVPGAALPRAVVVTVLAAQMNLRREKSPHRLGGGICFPKLP